MRCLLDKVTARYAVQGLLKLAEGRDLTGEELFTLDLFSHSQTLRLFIVPPTANVLHSLAQMVQYSAIIHLFLDRVEIALPTRYFKRWARRLRDYSFTREDAAVLALSIFGTDENATILGMHFVVTFDQAMINNWSVQQAAIQQRLTAMQSDIPAPYCHVSLPQVLCPGQIGV